MPMARFPDPRSAGPDGIVFVGGDLHPASLRLAYAQGIFPWPHPPYPFICWFCPDPRAILEFNRLHVPRSLRLARRRALREGWSFTIDHAFSDVIRQCARVPRPQHAGTWITPDMEHAYVQFHRLGYAHSVEAWRDGRLVGGLYGVDAGGAFAGESMFHLEPNASKFTLLHLIDHLAERGLDWIDIQMLTPHMEALGAHAVPRNEFLKRLAAAREAALKLF